MSLIFSILWSHFQYSMLSCRANFSIGALVLFGGFAVALIQRGRINKPFLTTSRQLRGEVTRTSISFYKAFQADRDLLTAANKPAVSTRLTEDHLPYKGRIMPFKLPQGLWIGACLRPSLSWITTIVTRANLSIAYHSFWGNDICSQDDFTGSHCQL